MKLQNILLFLLSVFILLSTVSPVIWAQNSISEEDLYNQAFDFCIRKDYPKGIETLNKLLSLYPHTMNEDVYWKLAQIHDENLYDYQKALEVYHMYLAKFPEGRFYTNFRARAAFLFSNQRDWEAIREYKQITDTSYTRSTKENIQTMHSLLKKYPQAVITPDMYCWLASQYQQIKDNKQALVFIKKYINTFPANGKTNVELIIASKQYSTILAANRQYKAAFIALKETLKYHINSFEYSETIKTLKKEQALWIGLEFSIAYIGLFLFLLLMAYPWREISFKFEPIRVIKWVLLLISGTLLPMFWLFSVGYGIWKVFYGLLVVSSIVLVLVKFSAPVAGKLNRPFYMLLCFLFIISSIYITYFWADNLSIFYQLPQF